MRKILVLFLILFFNILSVSAANMPDNVVNYIKKDFPKAEIRFDGLITIDNCIYLPLFPAKIKKPEVLEIKKTAPEGKTLKNLPDSVVFNNDFVLMKVIDEKDGKRTVLYQETPFTEVRTGLLPQYMLVPRGLIIPANIKSIGQYAFASCHSLKEITIPNTVTDIGRYAFAWCSRLEKVFLNNNAIVSADYSYYDYDYSSPQYGKKISRNALQQLEQQWGTFDTQRKRVATPYGWEFFGGESGEQDSEQWSRWDYYDTLRAMHDGRLLSFIDERILKHTVEHHLLEDLEKTIQ